MLNFCFSAVPSASESFSAACGKFFRNASEKVSDRFGKLLRMVMASAIAALPLEQRDVNVTGGDVSHVAVANVVQAAERWIVQAGDCVCC